MFWSLTACSWFSAAPPPEPPRPLERHVVDVAADCGAGQAAACVAFGNELSATGRDSEAIAAWTEACGLGSNRGCARILAGELATATDEGGPALLARAVELCGDGDALACAIEGRERLTGRWLDSDPERGRALLYQSCQNGIGIACEMFQ